jgi:hypothetical protein
MRNTPMVPSMKTLALALVSAAALLTAGSGCTTNYKLENDFGASPAYSSSERYQQIYRAWDYEGRQMMDDIDHIMLTRPPSRLTIWNVQ